MKPLLISRTADNTKKIAPLHSPLPTPGTATVTILVGTRKCRRQLFSWPLQSRLWVIRVVSDISATFRLDHNLGHGSRGGDHRGGHRTGSNAEPSAEALARNYRKGAVGGNPLRFRRLGFVLNSARNVAFGAFYGPELCSVNRAERPRSDRLSRRQQFWKLGHRISGNRCR